FLFQAEDGIRDFHVTGVQTCALPIYLGVRIFRDARNPKSRESLAADRRLARAMRRQRDRRLRRKARLIKVLVKHGLMPEDRIERSEERRVGKESESRRQRYPHAQNEQ